jgi:response regulator RpfG family c-di-GMP phosphodiesterase
MADKVLCVDDDANILSAYQRALRKLTVIDTALGGEEALRKLASDGPYAVVVSDMNMPGMDGAQFLAKAKAAAPDTVRMMLTGANDLRAATAAVNEGSIFRFLTKPCTPEALGVALEAGIRQHRLLTAEKELLEKTLKGSVNVLTDILALIDPISFGRGEALRSDIRIMCAALGHADTWEIEMAAMLARIGSLTIPPMVSLKAAAGHPLTAVEQDMIVRVPEVGAMLIANIPRMEGIAQIVLFHEKRFNGTGFPADSTSGAAIPFGARLLRLLSDFRELMRSGMSRIQALDSLKGRTGWYDPALVTAAANHLNPESAGGADEGPALRAVAIKELRKGQVLRSNIESLDGKILISSGYEVTATLLERIANYARLVVLKEPVNVEILPRHAGDPKTDAAAP